MSEYKILQADNGLIESVGVMRRRKGVIILFFLTCVSLVSVGSFVMKPVYSADVTILVDTESPNVLTTSGIVSLESQQYYSYKEYYQSQMEIITSMSIVKKAFDEFSLISQEPYKTAKEPLKEFLKTIKAEPIRDTRLIKLTVENDNPELAAKIANRIADIYVKRNLYYISRDELTNLLKNEYLKLETKLSEFNKIYKEKHPQMIRLKQEMEDMASRIESVKKSRFDSDFLSDIAADTKEEYALEGFKANNISVQDLAETPVVPVRPKKLLNISISVVAGLLGGIMLAFLFEYLDDTIKRPEDIENITKKPLLGSVPDMKKISGNMKEYERDILVHNKPKDPVSETYRLIRTNLLFWTAKDGAPLKRIVITSPGPQEGKTITLCNLGITMAHNNRKVLLVDADMRRPRLHNVFKIKNDKGLSNFLAGQESLEDLLRNTGVDNLFMISGGDMPPNPSELLSGPKFKEFLRITGEKFDVVLFDSPPVAVVTDAIVLAEVVDGVIVVIQSGKTSKRVLPRIYGLFENAGIKIIGTILNKVPIVSTDPYHYYYSRYYGHMRNK